MEYENKWPNDEERARKQFARRRREALVQKLRYDIEKRQGDVPAIPTIEGMVCNECRRECSKSRAAAKRQAFEEEQERRRKVEERQAALQRHYEWRTATAEEVDPTPHSAEFRAILSNCEVHEILFRWRAAPGKCRGESYLTKVGMWVDGTLTAHYWGWDLHRLDYDDDTTFYASEDKWPIQDLFGLGFCRWIERAFQQRLLRLTPNQTWGPRQYEELNTELIRSRPGTLQIDWIDGSGYVHILPSLSLLDVAEWAERNLELCIEERAFRPVRRTMAQSTGDEEEE
jgi:hypothetical protein